MGFYVFHTPKPRKFNYIPRYFDPEKEAWEKKKASMGLDSKLTDKEKLRIKLRNSYGIEAMEDNKKSKKIGFKGMRLLVFWGIMGVMIYIIFGTPLIDNFITMFLSLGK